VSKHCHWAFGDRLVSSMEIPELRPAPAGPARWSFRVVDRLPEPGALELLGEDPIYGSVSARLHRHTAGYRITIEDTGAFDILDGGSEILWQPTADPWWDFGRSHLIGRILGMSMQLSGTITMHASAVELCDGVVGFLAPKNFGKSTLALMLLRAGARFVTDDSLPLRPSAPIMAAPGIQSLRLRRDDARGAALLPDLVGGVPGRDGKLALPPLPPEQCLLAPAPLSALYFLRPRPPEPAGAAAARTPVAAVPAAMALLGQTKIGRMLGPRFARELLDGAVAIASSVPVYELSIARDLDRLPEVVDQVAEWHGLATLAAAPAGS
jgi:hypothetical protein